MQREQLKSKIHRAVVTAAEPEYEGSIEIPADLMRAADLWEREKVLVASITGGGRLETYVISGPEGGGEIVVNGGAALLIGRGERVTIMAFTWSDEPVAARIVLCDEQNRIARSEPPVEA
jgi:aspartate 1-decarboxylase